jgi:hypothetical protein
MSEKSGGRGGGTTAAPGGIPLAIRERIAQSFTRVEDVVYIGLGILLAASAVVLLADGALNFGRSLIGGTLPGRVIDLLDRILLILIIVEVLYTPSRSRSASTRSHPSPSSSSG